jgi:hypothetical protein
MAFVVSHLNVLSLSTLLDSSINNFLALTFGVSVYQLQLQLPARSPVVLFILVHPGDDYIQMDENF